MSKLGDEIRGAGSVSEMKSIMAATDSRLQERGHCCICGRLQALKGGRTLASHGYTVTWGYQNGACRGSGRPHYGHKDAPAFLRREIEAARAYLGQLPELIADVEAGLKGAEDRKLRRPLQGRLNELNGSLRALPEYIETLEARLEGWKELAPRLVDLPQEERERKQLAAEERDRKRAQKQAADEAKAKRAQEREERRKAKEKELLGLNWHQLHYRGGVVLEWQAEYTSDAAMIEDRRKRTGAYFDNLDLDEVERFEAQMWQSHIEIRTGQGKKGRRLYKSR